MRNIDMTFPPMIASKHLPSQTRQLSNQLHQQKVLNAKLLRICEQQSQLLAQQSSMIEEILEGMGK